MAALKLHELPSTYRLECNLIGLHQGTCQKLRCHGAAAQCYPGVDWHSSSCQYFA